MMTRATRRTWMVVMVAVGMLSGADARATDMFLETTRAKFQKIPIWIMGFGAGATDTRGTAELGALMVKVLKADLARTRVFAVLDRPTDSPTFSQAHCQGEEARAKANAGVGKAAVATWGRIGRTGDTLIVEVCARDGGGGNFTVGKRYDGSPPAMRLLRSMVHQWADELVKHYTGERGMARTRIVYVAEDADGGKDLHVMDYDGFGSRRVTTSRSLTLMPAWFPSRNALAYTAYRHNKQEIVLRHLDSDVTHSLVPPEVLNMTPAVSPDGRFIAYASAKQGNSNIFTVNLETSETEQLTSHPRAELSPAWSPDGRQLAFTSDRSGGPQIYIMQADGSRVRRVTFSGNYNAAPSWSPRGDWIAYVCRVPGAGVKLCRIDPDGRRRFQITTSAPDVIDDSPSWGPDGRHLVFSSMRNGQSHIYMIHFDGTGLEQLTTGWGRHASPAWSPL